MSKAKKLLEAWDDNTWANVDPQADSKGPQLSFVDFVEQVKDFLEEHSGIRTKGMDDYEISQIVAGTLELTDDEEAYTELLTGSGDNYQAFYDKFKSLYQERNAAYREDSEMGYGDYEDYD